MKKVMAFSLVLLYASFAPVCFAGSMTMSHVMPMATQMSMEHSGHTHAPQEPQPISTLSDHIQMYSIVTSSGPLTYSLTLAFLLVFFAILSLVLRICFSTPPRTLFRSTSHHRQRVFIVLLTHMRRMLHWIARHTQSPTPALTFVLVG